MTNDLQRAYDECGKAVAPLMEHCDSILILATGRGEEGTMTFARGGGNFYAQAGSARDWLKRQDAETAARELIRVKREDEYE